jgi:transcription elongation GreA/GreB family factor
MGSAHAKAQKPDNSVVQFYAAIRSLFTLRLTAFGAEIEVLTEGNTRQTFRIVGEDEADPTHGLIASFSPLGVALMGAELGSTVEWEKPTGIVDLEIVAIRFW